MTPQPDAKPLQFGIKHALIVLTLAAAWLAMLRSPTWRFLGQFAGLGALLIVSFFTLRWIRDQIARFVAVGVSPLCSGALAATAASTGALFYGCCMTDIFIDNVNPFETEFGSVAMFVVVALGIFHFGAAGIIVLQTLITIIEPFRGRLHDLPIVVASYVINAALGAGLFYLFCVVVGFFESPSLRLPPVAPFSLAGAFVGLIFGSSGVHTHLELAEEARARAHPERVLEGRHFDL